MLVRLSRLGQERVYSRKVRREKWVSGTCAKMFPKWKPSQEIFLCFLFIIFLCCCASCVRGNYRRFSLQSCSSLTPQPQNQGQNPQNFELYDHPQLPSDWRNIPPPVLRRSKREGYIPASILVDVDRYRRDTDVEVSIVTETYYDGLILQARLLSQDGNLLGARVGIVGHFELRRNERRNYTYLDCFHQEHATVVDLGVRGYGNVTFLWKPPEADRGNIRFAAGVTRGIYNWVIVSKILEFNPFPISMAQCGLGSTCLRVCPLDAEEDPCSAEEAQVVYSYNTDNILGRRDVEFNLGGQLSSPNSNYLAVVYADDYENLYNADVVICYVENGRPQIAHMILTVETSNMVQHQEEIVLDDSDYDGNMLWCRYRRPIGYSRSSFVSPRKSFYTFLYKGRMNSRKYPRFETPQRSDMYGSEQKQNFSIATDQAYAGGRSLILSTHCYQIIVSVLLILRSKYHYCN